MTPEPATLTLPFPPMANNLFVNHARTGGRFPSKRYTAWQAHAWHVLDQQQPLPVFRGEVEIHYQIGKPDKRRRDLANAEKALTDILVKRGVLEDDSFVHRMVLEWSEGHPGIVIAIIKGMDQ